MTRELPLLGFGLPVAGSWATPEVTRRTARRAEERVLDAFAPGGWGHPDGDTVWIPPAGEVGRTTPAIPDMASE